MSPKEITRRDFVKKATAITAGAIGVTSLSKAEDKEDIRCSSCNKSEYEVGKLHTADSKRGISSGTYLCDKCHTEAHEKLLRAIFGERD